MYQTVTKKEGVVMMVPVAPSEQRWTIQGYALKSSILKACLCKAQDYHPLGDHEPFRELYKLFQEEAYSRRIIIYQPLPFIINQHINQRFKIHNYNGNAQNNHSGSFSDDVIQEKQLIKENQKAAYDIYTSNIS